MGITVGIKGASQDSAVLMTPLRDPCTAVDPAVRLIPLGRLTPLRGELLNKALVETSKLQKTG